MENKTDLKEFETLVKKIDRNKYHVGRELSFSPAGAYISNWSIFRKDMPSTEYFSANNTAILSSAKGNTIEDIKEFMKKEGYLNESI